MRHYIIRRALDTGCYYMGEKFDTLAALVSRHSEDSYGLCQVLTNPCPRTDLNPDSDDHSDGIIAGIYRFITGAAEAIFPSASTDAQLNASSDQVHKLQQELDEIRDQVSNRGISSQVN